MGRGTRFRATAAGKMPASPGKALHFAAAARCLSPLRGHFQLSQMEADHITPWRDGGHTIPVNCQMLCRDCNRRKGAK